MPSPVEICNIALSNLGADNLVSAIDPPDGSVEAGYCATFYPIARTLCLEAAKPAFAKTRATLAAVANQSDEWLYAYAKPSDCIKPLRILQKTQLAALLVRDDQNNLPIFSNLPLEEAGTVHFETEGGVIRTNEPDAVLIYIRDETDTTKWTPMFADAVAALLTGYLAGPIIKGSEGARVGTDWKQQGYRMASAAAASAANHADEPAEHVPNHIRVRA
jgi:hypothetical protein